MAWQLFNMKNGGEGVFSRIYLCCTYCKQGTDFYDILEFLVAINVHAVHIENQIGWDKLWDKQVRMRVLDRLTDTKIKSLTKAGRHSDGSGLYLIVAPGGSKNWVYMWKRSGRRREMGLGGYPTVSLTRARKRAAEAREMILDGIDPVAERKKEAVPNFAVCVDRFLENKESEWRNAKHRSQWRNTLDTYCKSMATKPVNEIQTDDILRVLKPIWKTKSETASRVRGRIERVLDFADVHGWRSGDNPARWRGHLREVLPAREKLTRGHHKAINYKDLPALIKRLRTDVTISAHALEFLILTAARTGEVINANIKEIDHETKTWIVPASRMKAGVEHRVPLTHRAYEIIQGKTDFLFEGSKSGKGISNMAMAKFLKGLDFGDVTVHGMRSAFRDWAGDETQFPRELIEHALAHRIGDKAEQAYRRSDALERRRKLMQAWDKYLNQDGSEIIHLKRANT